MMRVLGIVRRLRLVLFAWRVRLHARVVGARVDVRLHPTARLRGRVHVHVRRGTHTVFDVGERSLIERGTLLHLGGGRLSVGPQTQIRSGCVLRVRDGVLVFAGRNVLSYYSTIHCDDRVEVGRMTIIGEHVTVSDTNHRRPDGPADSLLHNVTGAPIRIGNRGWIGAKVTITSGVTIGDDVVVAANAVVTSDLPDGTTAGGVPARLLRPEPR